MMLSKELGTLIFLVIIIPKVIGATPFEQIISPFNPKPKSLNLIIPFG
jgi:hypothetical protein